MSTHTRAARASVRGLSSGLPTGLHNAALTPRDWRGSSWAIGEAVKIAQGNPRVRAALEEIESAAVGAAWALRPANLTADGTEIGAETYREQRFRELLEAHLRAMRTDARGIDGARPRGSWTQWLARSFVDAWFVGAAVSERSWYRDATGAIDATGQRSLLELYDVPASSWERWDHDHATGQLKFLHQRTADGSGAIIPADRLVHMAWHGRPGLYEGAGVGESLCFLEQVLGEALSSEVRIIRNQSANKVELGPQTDTLENRDAARAYLEEDAEGNPWVIVPTGGKIDPLLTSASRFNLTEFAKWFDATVDQVLGRSLSSLGATSEGGSRALGAVLRDKDNQAWRETMVRWGRMVTDELFPLLARDLGFPDVRLPTLWVPTSDELRDVAQLVTLTTQAVTGGVLIPTAGLARHIGARIGLPEDVIAEQLAAASSRATAAASAASLAAQPVPGAAPAAASAPAEPAEASLNGAQIASALELLQAVSAGTLAEGAAVPMLEGLGFPTDRAQSMVAAQRSATPPAAAAPPATAVPASPPMAAGDHGRCACGSCRTTRASDDADDEEPAAVPEQLGADGRPVPWPMRRALFADEQAVSWATNEDTRIRLDEERDLAINAIAREHEQAVWRAASDGQFDATEANAVETEYRERYAAVLRRYLEAMREAVAAQAAEEFGRLVTIAPATGAPPDARARASIAAWAAAEMRRAEADVDVSARAIAGRVQTPAAMAAVSGVKREDYLPQRTQGSLGYEARSVGNRIESAGRISEATNRAPDGFALAEVTRIEIRDARLCDVCRERARITWPLTTAAEVEAFRSDPAAQTPDPECEGAQGGRMPCRCGFVGRFVRVATARAA